MNIADYLMLGEAGISLIAFVIGFIALKKNKTVTATKALKIATKAKNAADKKFEKICKKNNLTKEEAKEALKEEQKEIIL